MDHLFNEKLLRLGFEQKLETLFSLAMDDKLYSTSSRWLMFAYFEDGKYYFSDNGDMVETFDAPDIDILFMLEEIKKEIAQYGCTLNVSKIVKEIDLNNLERDFIQFIQAIHTVDAMYKSL